MASNRTRSRLSPGGKESIPSVRYRSTSSSGGVAVIDPGHRVGIAAAAPARRAIRRGSGSMASIASSIALM